MKLLDWGFVHGAYCSGIALWKKAGWVEDCEPPMTFQTTRKAPRSFAYWVFNDGLSHHRRDVFSVFQTPPQPPAQRGENMRRFFVASFVRSPPRCERDKRARCSGICVGRKNCLCCSGCSEENAARNGNLDYECVAAEFESFLFTLNPALTSGQLLGTPLNGCGRESVDRRRRKEGAGNAIGAHFHLACQETSPE